MHTGGASGAKSTGFVTSGSTTNPVALKKKSYESVLEQRYSTKKGVSQRSHTIQDGHSRISQA